MNARAFPSIAETVAAQREGRSSAVELLEAACAAVDRAAALNAMESECRDAALIEARALDAEAKAGRLRGPLHGIPVTVKDLYALAGSPMSAGTRAPLPAFPGDAAAVARLRAAGAVILGKTRMHEIALGITGENPWTGDVRNPHDPARQAGGSSSGAGVAVACGAGLIGLGSDTGGSVRIPAAHCGVVGFKPSFGAIPLAGALHLSPSFDHAGPLARSVADARAAFRALSLRDDRHGAAGRAPRLAVPSRWLAPRMEPEVAEAFARACAALRAAGTEIVEVDLPALDDAWTCYTPIVRAEAAFVHGQALEAGGTGFSAPVLEALRDGASMPAGRYLEALRLRAATRAALHGAAAGVDALLLPTSPVRAPLRGTESVDVAGGRMSLRQAVLGQTLPFSLAGLPALSLPMPVDGHLPAGLQLVAAFDADARLLALGEWVEGLLGGPGPGVRPRD